MDHRLPSELWRDIFQKVTFLPGFRETGSFPGRGSAQYPPAAGDHHRTLHGVSSGGVHHHQGGAPSTPTSPIRSAALSPSSPSSPSSSSLSSSPLPPSSLHGPLSIVHANANVDITFEPHRLPSPEFTSVLVSAPELAVRKSIRERAALVTVSRMWYGVGMEYLLELVYLQTHAQLAAFADMLDRRPELGRLVKRIDLVFDRKMAGVDSGVSGQTTPGETLKSIAEGGGDNERHPIERVLEACTSLEIFLDRTSFHEEAFPTMLLGRLARHSSSTLRHFAFRLSKGPSVRTVISHCASFSRLEVLSFTSLRPPPSPSTSAGIFQSLSPPPQPPVSFPRLHTLVLNPIDEWSLFLPELAKWDLPALTYVKCLRRRFTVSLYSFFKAHGSRIRVLELLGDHDLQPILTTCASSLTDLKVTHFVRDGSLPRLPHLKRFIRQNEESMPLSGVYPGVFDALSKPEITPSLEVIQFVWYGPPFEEETWPSDDGSGSASARNARRAAIEAREAKVAKWRLWEEVWETRGVKVLDSKGEVLRFPVPPAPPGSGMSNRRKASGRDSVTARPMHKEV